MEKRYGQWAGNNKGFPEDKEKCIVEVQIASEWTFRQCGRKRGFGEDKKYCAQHAKSHSTLK